MTATKARKWIVMVWYEDVVEVYRNLIEYDAMVLFKRSRSRPEVVRVLAQRVA